MKLRKILARGVALAACVAMLSTNVFAASELTLSAAGESGKLKVTISGAVDGQVTFLAVNENTTLSNSTAAADMQYIAQEAKATAADTVISFAQRAGGTSKVDLYAGGEKVTEVASLKGVYVKDSAELTAASKALECESASIPGDNAAWKTFLTGKITVDYAALGATVATPVALSAETAADFSVAAGTAVSDVYPVAVTYKGLAAGTVNVTATSSVSPIVSISATGIPSEAIKVYIAEGETFGDAEAKAEIEDITGFKVVATREDTTTTDVAFNDLTITYASGVATIKYGEFTAPETVAFNVITKAITSSEVVAPAPANVTLNVVEGTTVDTAYVEDKIGTKLSAFSAKYIWNNGDETPVPAGELIYTATKNGETSYTVAITTAKAAFATPVTVAVTINVTPAGAAKTAIKGSVKSSDSTGLVWDFTNGIPVGAVVTAIPYNEESMGNVTGTEEAFTAVSTVVDAEGNFELEVAPGKYTVIVAHTKYAIYAGEIYISRTVLDSNSMQEVTVEANEEKDLGAIALKYTYFGDINQNGTLDRYDYLDFTSEFGSSVN